MLAVDGKQEDDFGSYQLDIELTEPSPNQGESCQQPFVIDNGGLITGDTSQSANYYGGMEGMCIRSGGLWGYNAGPDHIYQINVPANATLNVTSSADGWDHVVSINSDCSDLRRSCLAWDDYGSVSARNRGPTAQNYFIVVAGFFEDGFGPYELEISVNLQ
jgi:hypothetical protein